MNNDQRICAEHLSRSALIYVRQSSPSQVRGNPESTRVQLGLCEKAVALGWRKPRVIDEDLGLSASGYVDRPGFQELLTRVAMREVGIILCLDASRLSRNSKDWAHLFELCSYFATLIADLEQVYDLGQPNDRLLMGIKGTVSEMELTVLRARLQSGTETKAARGELKINLPIGYVYDACDKIVVDPDERVQRAHHGLRATRSLLQRTPARDVVPRSCPHPSRQARWQARKDALGASLTHENSKYPPSPDLRRRLRLGTPIHLHRLRRRQAHQARQ